MAAAPGETDLVAHEIRIEAEPETVFAHFTDPARMVRWMGTEATLDPRPGGVCRLVIGEAVMLGEYVEVVPYSRVVFSWGWERTLLSVPPASSLVEVALTPDEGATHVRLTHRRLPEGAHPFHTAGWSHFMPRLAAASGGLDPGPDRWVGGEGRRMALG